MQDSSAFQYLAIDTIHESANNPRVTFEPARLEELAASIRQHGLIQPITVRPNADGFEIVAGARRFRAAQMAELFSVPVHIVNIDDAHALELALAENILRAEVHPYEEAAGLRRLLDMPGYDVATLAEKFGKTASHIYARLSLLQLIPEVAEAFTQDRITASHANLIARLPQESQAKAFEQCWRKDWNDKEPHLLPAKHLAAWIQSNLYLSLADAPFDRDDATLNPSAGACTSCPRRSGYNTLLFPDAVSDQCLDAKCHAIKIANFIDRAIAAQPELVQIEEGWRRAKDQRPGAVPRGHFREIEAENPDAEPLCAASKPAIVVYGKRIGRLLTVCTDDDCPVHDPRTAESQSQITEPAPVMEPAGEDQTEDAAQAEEPDRETQQRRKDYQAEQERRAEARSQELARRQQEYEAQQARRDELRKARAAQFDRILAHAPATFTAAQLRVFLRALIHLDPHTLIEDLAAHFNGDDENDQRCAEEVLLDTIGGLADDQLTGFALRLALTGHTGLPIEGVIDFLAEAEAALIIPEPRKPAIAKKPKTPAKPHPRRRQRRKRSPLKSPQREPWPGSRISPIHSKEKSCSSSPTN